MSTLVLPQRFVGDTSTMNGEMSPASIVHACNTQSARATSALFRQDDVATEHPLDGIEERGAVDRLGPRLDLPVWQGALVVLRLNLFAPHLDLVVESADPNP